MKQMKVGSCVHADYQDKKLTWISTSICCPLDESLQTRTICRRWAFAYPHRTSCLYTFSVGTKDKVFKENYQPLIDYEQLLKCVRDKQFCYSITSYSQRIYDVTFKIQEQLTCFYNKRTGIETDPRKTNHTRFQCIKAKHFSQLMNKFQRWFLLKQIFYYII